MGTVMYAWELGANYGHILDFLPLASRLRDRGHKVILVARDLSRIESVLGEHDFAVLQAPVWRGKLQGLPEPQVSYADIMLRAGFYEKGGLAGLEGAWRQLYALAKPDLLMVDHGPTALLAAFDGKVPRALIGNGFFMPPPVVPLPNMRPWLQVSPQRLASVENKVVEVANDVLQDLDGPTLNVLADLFRVDETFLCTLREIDPYHESREGARYRGPIDTAKRGVCPPWPSVEGKKVFGYLSPKFNGFEKILQALASLPCASLIYGPGITDKVIKENTTEIVNISRDPVDMTYARRECDLAICHAGPGTTMLMLMAGIPLCLLPVNLEQGLTTRRAWEEGAAVTPEPGDKNPDYRKLMTRLIEESSFSERAQAFAQSYADHDQDAELDRMAERCEELMGEDK